MTLMHAFPFLALPCLCPLPWILLFLFLSVCLPRLPLRLLRHCLRDRRAPSHQLPETQGSGGFPSQRLGPTWVLHPLPFRFAPASRQKKPMGHTTAEPRAPSREAAAATS